MISTIIKFFGERHNNWNIGAVKRKAKKRYKDIITDLPDIGSITENSMRVCLSGGAVWLAFYESCEENITEEEFGEMVKATMNAPIIVKVFSNKKPFTKEAQLKKRQ